MSKRFYGAWAFAVLLAIVLPIAIPYLVWPPREGPKAAMAAECGRRAEMDACHGTHPIASLWPLSAEVESCRSSEGFLIYNAEVKARGPYGIPFAAARVTERDYGSLNPNGGFALGIVALLVGAVAVSVPFFPLWLRHALSRRPLLTQ